MPIFSNRSRFQMILLPGKILNDYYLLQKSRRTPSPPVSSAIARLLDTDSMLNRRRPIKMGLNTVPKLDAAGDGQLRRARRLFPFALVLPDQSDQHLSRPGAVAISI